MRRIEGNLISSHGYVLVHNKTHPRSFGSGYVYEHILVAEKMLGRFLKKQEIVHHKDGDKKNNKPSNLVVCKNIAEHKLLHRKNKDMRKPNEKNIFIECACGCGGKMRKYDSSGRPRKYLVGHQRKGKLSYDPNAVIPCSCGCGKVILKHDKYGRLRRFAKGHYLVIANQFGKGQFWIQSPFNGTPNWVRIHSVAPPLPHERMTSFIEKMRNQIETEIR